MLPSLPVGPFGRRSLVIVLLSCSVSVSVVPNPSNFEPISFEHIPGRPLQGHFGKDLRWQRLIPLRNRVRDSPVSTRRSSSHDWTLQAYIVKVTTETRKQVVAAVKQLVPGVVLQYLHHDSYVVALPQHIVDQVAELEGVHTVLILPPEMKVSPEMLEELYGEQSTALNRNRRTSKRMERSNVPSSKAHQRRLGSKDPQPATAAPEISIRGFDTEEEMAPAGSVADLGVVVGRGGRPSAFDGQWQNDLAAAGLGRLVEGIHDGGRGPVIVKVRGEEGAVLAVVRWLMARGEVVFVERRSKMHLLRVERTPGAVGEGGAVETRNLNSVPELLGAEDESGEPLVWSRGIRGEGQVIAVADSGLDYDHCAFADDAALISFCDGLGTCQSPGRHRKIYSYRVFSTAEAGDEVAGHGTHVVGSAVASTLDGAGFEMKGAAPDAKVAFEDGGRESAPTAEGRAALRFPELMTDLFDPSFDAGIRVHSDSWGIASQQYESLSQEVDEYMYDNPDYLVVFAAGNNGSFGYLTVGAPATSKNAIAVGAAENVVSAYPFAEQQAMIQVTESTDGAGQRAYAAFAEFGAGEARELVQEEEIAWVVSDDEDPSIGCGAVQNAAALSGKVAVIRRGECTFQIKCASAEAAGAVGCLVANNVAEAGLVVMAGDETAPSVSIPSVFVAQDAGDELATLLASGPVRLSFPVYEYEPSNVASFSSRGPVATGEQILSTRGDGDLLSEQCSEATAAFYESGTSMSAPQVAGAAALVRQYFQEGYLGAGSPDAAAGFTPSAALVKGVILHSGEQLAYPKQGADMGIFPDMEQGHGSLRLSSALSFGAEVSGFSLAAFDREEVEDGALQAFCISGVDASQPLKITLHWTDPPGSQSAFYVLVNNLDLSVEHTDSGERAYGNQLPGVSAEGDNLPVLDEVNNNEQITWRNPSAGSYRVFVSGRDVAIGPQTFALVVTGSFSTAAACSVAADEACPGGGSCSGHGSCLPSGVCACEATHSGADCATDSGILTPDRVTLTPEIGVSGWVYYVIPVYGDQTWSINTVSLEAAGESDPDLYVAYGRLPTLQDFDGVDFNSGSITSLTIGYEDVDKPADLASAEDGYWVLGIFAYCCAPSKLQIAVTMGPSQRPETSSDGSDGPTSTALARPGSTPTSTTVETSTTVAPTTSTTVAPTTSTTTVAPTTTLTQETSTRLEPTTSSTTTAERSTGKTPESSTTTPTGTTSAAAETTTAPIETTPGDAQTSTPPPETTTEASLEETTTATTTEAPKETTTEVAETTTPQIVETTEAEETTEVLASTSMEATTELEKVTSEVAVETTSVQETTSAEDAAATTTRAEVATTASEATTTEGSVDTTAPEETTAPATTEEVVPRTPAPSAAEATEQPTTSAPSEQPTSTNTPQEPAVTSEAWTPQTPPPSTSARVAFTLALAMDRSTFMRSVDSYLAAVAAAAEVEPASVFVTDVVEVTARRRGFRRLLATSVEVSTEVVVEDTVAVLPAESTAAIEVASKIADGGLARELAAQGLPEGQFTAEPEARQADSEGSALEAAGETDGDGDDGGSSSPATTPAPEPRSQSSGPREGVVYGAAAGAAALLLAVGGFVCWRMRSNKPAAPPLPRTRVGPPASSPPPVEPPSGLSTASAPAPAAAQLVRPTSGGMQPMAPTAAPTAAPDVVYGSSMFFHSFPMLPSPGQSFNGMPAHMGAPVNGFIVR